MSGKKLITDSTCLLSENIRRIARKRLKIVIMKNIFERMIRHVKLKKIQNCLSKKKNVNDFSIEIISHVNYVIHRHVLYNFEHVYFTFQLLLSIL